MTKRKGTPSHYRQRIDRLKRRADYLRQALIDRPDRSEASKHHLLADISALDWAVSILEPWFAKEDDDAFFAEPNGTQADDAVPVR